MRLAAVIAAIGVALVIYSQTWAFAWDEGFHLLAAQLITKGHHPYADFLFAQTPLNAYWNALLIWIFGATWRPEHTAAAIETVATLWLIADFVRVRMGDRFAICAAVLLGLNPIVFMFGTIAQPYAMCMLLGVVAFRFVVSGRNFLSGVAGGAAAAGSLLTAPICPVVFAWLVLRSRSLRKAGWFAAGAVVGFGPVFYAFLRWPRLTWFDLVGFHLHYRQAQWQDWPTHDLGVVTDWLNTASGFVLVMLAGLGISALRRATPELRLCGWLAVAQGLFVALAHPTFPQYFAMTIPFAAVLAIVGLGSLGDRNSRAAVSIAICVTAAGLARSIVDGRDDTKWSDFSNLVRTVDDVTAPGAAMLADEQIYFLTNRTPPPGLEWTSSHKAEMPVQAATRLHLVSQSELDRRIRRGEFATLETCYETEVARLGLRQLYAREKQDDDCYVFWSLK